jgi:6-phosphogluconolactonase (cycloisomerase 2 family)
LPLGLLIAVAAGFFSLGGCSGSGPSSPPTLTSIAITPANAAVSVGSNQQLTAQGIYSDGTMTDISSSVSWSSSDETLASISSSGLAAAAAIGRPQVTATSGGVTGSTRLIVVEGTWVARFAYSVGGPTISIFSVDAASGQLQANGSLVRGNNEWPFTIAIDPAGKFAHTANTGHDSVTAFNIDPAGGRLTAISDYGTGYGPNSVGVDPSGSFVYATNGAGGCSGPVGSISGYWIDRSSGKLTPIAGSPFAAGCDDFGFIVVHPGGKFVYISDYNGVSVFAIDVASGALAAAGSVVGIGNIAFDPTGKIAIARTFANGAPATMSSFTVDATTGALSQVSGSPLPAGSVQTFPAICPSGKYAYVANQANQGGNNFVSNIFGFSIDSTTGALTALPTGPLMAGSWPQSLVTDPSGKFLYYLSSPPGSASTITTYAIDDATGDLTAVNSVQIPLGPQNAGTLAMALSP